VLFGTFANTPATITDKTPRTSTWSSGRSSSTSTGTRQTRPP
jgi:hypothetical protein